MKTLHIRMTFMEEILGTASNDPRIQENFISDSAPDAPSREEEIAAIGVEKVVEMGMTVFPRNPDGQPIAWDYQIKGFFKDACGALARIKNAKKGELGHESAKLKAYKKVIDGLVFPGPRSIPIIFDGEIGSCQRPLRAQTAQGERVALANSETIPAGAYMDVDIKLLSDDIEPQVREWLNYGEFRGMFQWRNSGKGRFSWEELA